MRGGQRAADEQPPDPAQAGGDRRLRPVVVGPQQRRVRRERLGEHRRRDRPDVAGGGDDQPGRALHAQQVEPGQVAQVDRRVQPERVGARLAEAPLDDVELSQAPDPGTQPVPASGTRAIAAASTVSATRSSGSRLWTCDLPHARASVCVSSVSVRR